MIWVFLPAYNEEIALPRLLKKFDDTLKAGPEKYRVVVQDDGSSDDTAAVAEQLTKQYPVTVLRHAKNMGLGETMRDGFRYLLNVVADEDVIVTLDCDDTHEAKFVPAAIQKLRSGCDVVVLSRFCKGGGQEGLSGTKTFLSQGAGLFLKILFPIRGVREYSCNFRVFSGAILKKADRVFGKDFIRLAHLGFAVSPEILIKMRMLGARIAESPFVLRYDQKPTASKNNALRTIKGYFAIVCLYWGRRV
jgi:dolichol-phosphate mannosyltransferase